jgi:hypothetical protein
MNINELEVEALKLDPKARARLAGKLLKSLEDLSEEENAMLWAEEANRRDAEMDADPDSGISAADVFREARAKWLMIHHHGSPVMGEGPGDVSVLAECARKMIEW